ncbi:hypothetical protein [Methylobacterium oryzihabitans]|uniref:Uncharacterized protein n=1 Tax=Methylobacterium oryzihabitans TaxID=2499852 RepID=A0A3S2V2E1_9HYPH|nr:hypothetical protein [Methylobacterium oryzihabitans]RVU12498.1 hypothetical protein EOE48_27825 [Methylobacterium oryzihabitans]
MALGIRLKSAHQIVTLLTATSARNIKVIASTRSPVSIEALYGFKGLGTMVILMARSPVEHQKELDIHVSAVSIHQEIWQMEHEQEHLQHIHLYN